MFWPLSSGQRRFRICCARPLHQKIAPSSVVRTTASGNDSAPLRKRLIRLPSSRRRFLLRICIWCRPYSSGSQLPRPGGGVMLRSTHSHHDRRIKFQKCQISKPVTAASKNHGRCPTNAPRIRAGIHAKKSSSASLFHDSRSSTGHTPVKIQKRAEKRYPVPRTVCTIRSWPLCSSALRRRRIWTSTVRSST